MEMVTVMVALYGAAATLAAVTQKYEKEVTSKDWEKRYRELEGKSGMLGNDKFQSYLVGRANVGEERSDTWAKRYDEQHVILKDVERQLVGEQMRSNAKDETIKRLQDDITDLRNRLGMNTKTMTKEEYEEKAESKEETAKQMVQAKIVNKETGKFESSTGLTHLEKIQLCFYTSLRIAEQLKDEDQEGRTPTKGEVADAVTAELTATLGAGFSRSSCIKATNEFGNMLKEIDVKLTKIGGWQRKHTPASTLNRFGRKYIDDGWFEVDESGEGYKAEKHSEGEIWITPIPLS